MPKSSLKKPFVLLETLAALALTLTILPLVTFSSSRALEKRTRLLLSLEEKRQAHTFLYTILEGFQKEFPIYEELSHIASPPLFVGKLPGLPSGRLTPSFVHYHAHYVTGRLGGAVQAAAPLHRLHLSIILTPTPQCVCLRHGGSIKNPYLCSDLLIRS